jgi:polar amino acid transport system substrate-binding protein
MTLVRMLRGGVAAYLAFSSAMACAQTVRVAHAQSFPPYAEARDGRSEGMAVDLLRAAAAKAGMELAFVVVPFEELQRTLEDGRAELIFPTGITPERRKTLDFSAPLLSTGGSLYVRAPGLAPDDFGSLAGKTVVTPRTGPLAAYIEKNAPEVKVMRTASYEESLAQLVEGKADAAALNSHVGGRIADKLYPGKVNVARRMFLEVPLAVAAAKGTQAASLEQLDKGLAAIRADGTWDQISRRWVGQ